MYEYKLKTMSLRAQLMLSVQFVLALHITIHSGIIPQKYFREDDYKLQRTSFRTVVSLHSQPAEMCLSVHFIVRQAHAHAKTVAKQGLEFAP
jgi:hypothetical protein